MAEGSDFDYDIYDVGGEFHPGSYQEVIDRLGQMATRDNDWGADSGGELANLLPRLWPPDLGSVALNLPDAENRQVELVQANG